MLQTLVLHVAQRAKYYLYSTGCKTLLTADVSTIAIESVIHPFTSP